MLLGYNTNGFAHHRLADTLAILADLGYQSVAITLDCQALNPYDPELPRELDRVIGLLARHRLRNVVETGARFLLDPRRKHQPTLLSADPAGRERRLDFLRRAIDIAHVLQSDAVSFWSGAADAPADDATYWRRLTDGCHALLGHAEPKGVRLAFEPEPGMFVDTLARHDSWPGRPVHSRFGLTLDIGHVHCMSEGPIADQIMKYGKQIFNIHIEDMRRGIHDHLLFGEGEIDFPPVFRSLHAIAYAGGVHIELSRHSHNAVETALRAAQFIQPWL